MDEEVNRDENGEVDGMNRQYDSTTQSVCVTQLPRIIQQIASEYACGHVRLSILSLVQRTIDTGIDHKVGALVTNQRSCAKRDSETAASRIDDVHLSVRPSSVCL